MIPRTKSKVTKNKKYKKYIFSSKSCCIIEQFQTFLPSIGKQILPNEKSQFKSIVENLFSYHVDPGITDTNISSPHI